MHKREKSDKIANLSHALKKNLKKRKIFQKSTNNSKKNSSDIKRQAN
tara:strand:- start:308 stop:448 length:141 start_codon:yes stop_codon:yes gene_type:complete